MAIKVPRGRPRIYDDANEDRVTIRIHKALRRTAEQAAAENGQSLNFWIAKAIEQRLDRDRAERKGGR